MGVNRLQMGLKTAYAVKNFIRACQTNEKPPVTLKLVCEPSVPVFEKANVASFKRTDVRPKVAENVFSSNKSERFLRLEYL